MCWHRQPGITSDAEILLLAMGTGLMFESTTRALAGIQFPLLQCPNNEVFGLVVVQFRIIVQNP